MQGKGKVRVGCAQVEECGKVLSHSQSCSVRLSVSELEQLVHLVCLSCHPLQTSRQLHRCPRRWQRQLDHR